MVGFAILLSNNRQAIPCSQITMEKRASQAEKMLRRMHELEEEETQQVRDLSKRRGFMRVCPPALATPGSVAATSLRGVMAGGAA